MTDNELLIKFRDHGFLNGRMISGSKTAYRMRFPNNEIYFNANIFTLEDGKIWYGDLDITLDNEILTIISKELGKKLYIIREMDGRFDNEKLSNKEIINKAVKVIEN